VKAVAEKSEVAVNPVGAKPKHALFEPIGLLLLSLATVGTAWCSFQAASWQAQGENENEKGKE